MSVTAEQIERAADIVMRGGVVAFPTETVYGVGALATDQSAVERVFRMKGRPSNRPLIVHLHHAAQIDAFAQDVPEYARRLAVARWPGPVTIVVTRRPHVLDAITAGGDTVALRVPDHPVALELLRQVLERGGQAAGIAAPSANPFGKPPPTTAQAVVEGLGAPAVDDDAAPDMILDGGECSAGVPSTIVSCVGQWPRILRYGAMTREEIEDVLGQFVDQ